MLTIAKRSQLSVRQFKLFNYLSQSLEACMHIGLNLGLMLLFCYVIALTALLLLLHF